MIVTLSVEECKALKIYDLKTLFRMKKNILYTSLTQKLMWNAFIDNSVIRSIFFLENYARLFLYIHRWKGKFKLFMMILYFYFMNFSPIRAW